MSRWVQDIIKLTVRKARMCGCILVWLWIFGREKKLNAELSTWKGATRLQIYRGNCS